MEPNQHFIQDVISFIDAPLSPSSLNKLKKSCRGQGFDAAATAAAAASAPTAEVTAQSETAVVGQAGVSTSPRLGETPVYSSMAYLYPIGSEVEAQHLHNTTEFNGMRGSVVGHQDGKLLVEFYGHAGQFDIPTFNVKVIGPGTSAARGASIGGGLSTLPLATPTAVAPLPPAPTVLPVNPSYPVYASPSLSTHTASLFEVNSLKDKLRMSMTHVEVAKDALTHAAALDVLNHEEMVNVVSELQPTLSRQNISKNWRKIVQIYMAHAEKVSTMMVEREVATNALAPREYSAVSAASPAATAAPMLDLAGNLESVINFIDKPLSPRTLKEMKQIRHSCSPRRGRSSSP